MALDLTAYATTTEYRDRNGRVSTDSDVLLSAFLLSVSRVIDRRLGVSPGHFKPQTALTYYVTARGGTLLRLRDERGEQLFLRTATAIGIDSERDATYDGSTMVLGTDAWVRGFPVNSATSSEPFTALSILPGVLNADPTEWGDCYDVRVTGTWGWAATPGAIKDRVIGLTRELAEVHSSGASSLWSGSMTIEQIDNAITSTPTARALMYLLEMEYNYRVWV